MTAEFRDDIFDPYWPYSIDRSCQDHQITQADQDNQIMMAKHEAEAVEDVCQGTYWAILTSEITNEIALQHPAPCQANICTAAEPARTNSKTWSHIRAKNSCTQFKKTSCTPKTPCTQMTYCTQSKKRKFSAEDDDGVPLGQSKASESKTENARIKKKTWKDLRKEIPEDKQETRPRKDAKHKDFDPCRSGQQSAIFCFAPLDYCLITA